MSAPRAIPDDVRRRQHKASDPSISAWVAANAGAGKTHVLAQRVIRLLLEGVDPAKILCVTFTKAAAANMAMRVYAMLARWTTYDDDALDRAILDVGSKSDAKRRARARRLFAGALETPGGLKVQTIHAFCTRLLHQFPFEANVAARFDVLDETSERQLLDQIALQAMLAASAKPESVLGRALHTAIATAADQTFRETVGEAIRKRDRIEKWIAAAGGAAQAIRQLAEALGVDDAQTGEDIEAEFWSASLVPPSEWAAVAAALAEGSENDRKQVARLQAAETAVGPAKLDAYLSVFCNAELAPRKNIVTRAIAGKHPALVQRLLDEQQRVCALLDRRRAVDCLERSAALLVVAESVISRYRAEKERRGLLDYDDLIEKTAALLKNTDAAWIHYKLDLGIDHVLIDEAQDTSPRQWDIICRLVSEFTSGAGARSDVKRTVFAVGDEKQAIFSFQGSAPRQFAEIGRQFHRAHEKSRQAFLPVILSHSFRSGANVLGAVDIVYRDERVYASVTADQSGVPQHEPLPGATPGEVEIWPLVEAEDKQDVTGWRAPFDALEETSPRIRLAQKIARNVRAWLDAAAPAGQKRSPLSPKDILILVRQRGPLFEAVIRALKNAQVPVAGADRLVLTEHIAVMDLIALADALLLPEDDLALATVLKSPLFGLDDDDLFTLCWNRGGPLRLSLKEKAAGNSRFAEAAAQLDELAAAARRQSPFDFYAHFLGRGQGRKRILARLGSEANDALDEFLNLLLTYENRETPSLQGFVAWLRAAQAEVKRDMEMTRDEVRVMTVHGAKGLEAPIVVLADTTTPPGGYHPPRLLPLDLPNGGTALIWAGPKDQDPAPVAQSRKQAVRAVEDEYRRLLYVGMTRAEEKLVVCGASGRKKKDGTSSMPEGCWYSLIHEALKSELVEADAADGDGKIWRYRKVSAEDALASAQDDKTRRQEPIALPSWLHRETPASPSEKAAMRPSGAIDDNETFSSAQRARALSRGRLVHRLMQSLPDIPAARREQAAQAYLARAGGEFSDSERADMVTQALGVLADPTFAPLFSAGSRAEIPIVGRLEQPAMDVFGQVDRLAITEKVVLIADYKTDRPAPQRLEDVSFVYKRQLALYRAALELLYPGHEVRAALLWTDSLNLMEIPGPALDAALTSV